MHVSPDSSLPTTADPADAADTAAVDVGAVVSALRAGGCVFAEDEAALILDAATTSADVAGLVARRVAGFPLEHVVGHARFCGLRIAVDPGVFVPRRRTEFLVRQADSLVSASLIARSSPAAAAAAIVVLDLCCGSGALGVALASALTGRAAVELHAADHDPAAVLCARRNAEPFGGRVYEGDLFEALPGTLRGRVDVLLANVPYVPSDRIALLPTEARVHEPRAALDGGGDGLDVLRRVVGPARAWLAPGGHLLVETTERQVPAALRVLADGGLEARVVVDDELEATVLIGTRV